MSTPVHPPKGGPTDDNPFDEHSKPEPKGSRQLAPPPPSKEADRAQAVIGYILVGTLASVSLMAAVAYLFLHAIDNLVTLTIIIEPLVTLLGVVVGALLERNRPR